MNEADRIARERANASKIAQQYAAASQKAELAQQQAAIPGLAREALQVLATRGYPNALLLRFQGQVSRGLFRSPKSVADDKAGWIIPGAKSSYIPYRSDAFETMYYWLVSDGSLATTTSSYGYGDALVAKKAAQPYPEAVIGLLYSGLLTMSNRLSSRTDQG